MGSDCISSWSLLIFLLSMGNVKNVMKYICAAYVDSRKKHF